MNRPLLEGEWERTERMRRRFWFWGPVPMFLLGLVVGRLT